MMASMRPSGFYLMASLAFMLLIPASIGLTNQDSNLGKIKAIGLDIKDPQTLKCNLSDILTGKHFGVEFGYTLWLIC